LTRDEEDKNNSNLLGYVQTISIKASNSAWFTSHLQSNSVHSYEPRKFVDLLSMSPYSKMFESTKSFACRVIICTSRS
jgi:hypothetical protein